MLQGDHKKGYENCKFSIFLSDIFSEEKLSSAHQETSRQLVKLETSILETLVNYLINTKSS